MSVIHNSFIRKHPNFLFLIGKRPVFLAQKEILILFQQSLYCYNFATFSYNLLIYIRCDDQHKQCLPSLRYLGIRSLVGDPVLSG